MQTANNNQGRWARSHSLKTFEIPPTSRHQNICINFTKWGVKFLFSRALIGLLKNVGERCSAWLHVSFSCGSKEIVFIKKNIYSFKMTNYDCFSKSFYPLKKKKKCRKRLQEKNYVFKKSGRNVIFFSPLTKCRGINHFLFFFLKITLSLLMSMLTFFSVFPDSDFLYTCHGFVKTFRAQHFPESFSTSEKKKNDENCV